MKNGFIAMESSGADPQLIEFPVQPFGIVDWYGIFADAGLICRTRASTCGLKSFQGLIRTVL